MTDSIIKACFILLAVLMLLPGLAWVGLMDRRGRRKLRRAVTRRKCLSCHSQLGPESLTLAAEYQTQIEQSRKQRYPEAKFMLAPPVDAICPTCGCKLMYDWNADKFQLHVSETISSSG